MQAMCYDTVNKLIFNKSSRWVKYLKSVINDVHVISKYFAVRQALVVAADRESLDTSESSLSSLSRTNLTRYWSKEWLNLYALSKHWPICD